MHPTSNLTEIILTEIPFEDNLWSIHRVRPFRTRRSGATCRSFVVAFARRVSGSWLGVDVQVQKGGMTVGGADAIIETRKRRRVGRDDFPLRLGRWEMSHACQILLDDMQKVYG